MITNLKLKEIIFETICLLFIVLFIYGAVSKLIDLDNFQAQLKRFPFIQTHGSLVAWAVPAVQILISITFFFSQLKLKALCAALLLLLLYSIYIIAVINYAEVIPCSCGGIIETFTWNQHLVFNTGCILLAALGITLYPKIPREGYILK